MNASKKSGRGSQRLWRGLTTVTASVLALALCAQPLVSANRTDLDKFLRTQSSKIVTDDSDSQDLFAYKSDYTSTTELLDAIEDLGERMSEEGTVLRGLHLQKALRCLPERRHRPAEEQRGAPPVRRGEGEGFPAGLLQLLPPHGRHYGLQPHPQPGHRRRHRGPGPGPHRPGIHPES